MLALALELELGLPALAVPTPLHTLTPPFSSILHPSPVQDSPYTSSIPVHPGSFWAIQYHSLYAQLSASINKTLS